MKPGISNLQNAEDSDSASERETPLRAARNNFQKTVYLEKDTKRAIALLGLACCHAWLGDRRNSLKRLNDILDINPIKLHMLIKGADRLTAKDYNRGGKQVLVGVLLVISLAIIFLHPPYEFPLLASLCVFCFVYADVEMILAIKDRYR